jgi:hypothetical protein
LIQREVLLDKSSKKALDPILDWEV